MSLKNSVLLRALPPQWYDRLLTAKQSSEWRWFRGRWHRQHVETTECCNPWLNQALLRVQPGSSNGAISVLEFGCSTAHNLCAMRRNPQVTIGRYCGIDISRQAIDLARSRYPEASFHAANHDWFIRNAPTLGSFDLFVASHVLYYLNEREVSLLLEAAREVSTYIYVMDKLDRFDEESGDRTGLFIHPYRRICSELGLELLEVNREAAHKSEAYGYFLACAGRHE